MEEDYSKFYWYQILHMVIALTFTGAALAYSILIESLGLGILFWLCGSWLTTIAVTWRHK